MTPLVMNIFRDFVTFLALNHLNLRKELTDLGTHIDTKVTMRHTINAD